MPCPRVIVVGDREEPAPASFGGATVVASDGAVAVVTRHEVDGDVTIRLADETEVRPLGGPRFLWADAAKRSAYGLQHVQRSAA